MYRFFQNENTEEEAECPSRVKLPRLNTARVPTGLRSSPAGQASGWAKVVTQSPFWIHSL